MLSKGKKITKFVLIPLLLGLVWLGLTARYAKEMGIGLFSIDIYYSASEVYYNLEKSVVGGSFRSELPYLTTVKLRLARGQKGTGKILFRIKEQGSNDWYYKVQYDDIGPGYNSFVLFNFPLIINSENRDYHFEVEFLDGDKKRVESIFSSKYPALVAVHDFPRIESWERKIKSLNRKEFFANTAIFLLPLLVYLRSLAKRRGDKILKLILLLAVVVSTFFVTVRDSYDPIFAVIFLSWSYVLRRYGLSGRVSIFVAMTLLSFSVVATILGSEALATRSFAWMYLLLAAAVVRQVSIFFRSR